MTFNIEIVITDSPKVEANANVKGMNLIGNGSFAKVWTKDNDIAIKIFSADDQGYFNWLKVVQELGMDNPYLPKIYQVIHYRHPAHWLGYDANTVPGHSKDDYVVVWMEHLTGFRLYTESDLRHNKALIRASVKFEKYARRLNEFIMETLDEDKGTKLQIKINEMLNKLRVPHLDVMQLLVTAVSMHEGSFIDIHSFNVMIRNGRQLVLTDPIAV